MAAVYVAALLLAWLVARLQLQPTSVPVAGTAALVVASLFALYPAEGLGVFLLFSLLANTWQYRFDADLQYFDEIGLLMFVVVGVVRHGAPNGRLRWGLAETA